MGKDIITFIHILCGVTFLGLMIASFFYIANSLRLKNSAMIQYALRTSFLGDVIILPMVLAQFVTGAMMVVEHQIPFKTLWIMVAFHLFGLVSVCWGVLVWIKYQNTRRECDLAAPFKYKKLFYLLNVAIFILFALIIHDAVTQSTWF